MLSPRQRAGDGLRQGRLLAPGLEAGERRREGAAGGERFVHEVMVRGRTDVPFARQAVVRDARRENMQFAQVCLEGSIDRPAFASVAFPTSDPAGLGARRTRHSAPMGLRSWGGCFSSRGSSLVAPRPTASLPLIAPMVEMLAFIVGLAAGAL